MNRSIPSRHVPIKSATPWINRDIKNDTAKRERMFRRAKHSKSQDHLSWYKGLRNSIIIKIYCAKKSFFEKLSQHITSNQKFWSIIRSVSPRKSFSSGSLSYGSVSVNGVQDKPNLLHELFATCFNSTFVPSTISHSVPNEASIEDALNRYDCTDQETEALLRGIKPHSATGPDGVTSWMLCSFSKDIAPSLSSLFNLSIRVGRIPSIVMMFNHCNLSPCYQF